MIVPAETTSELFDAARLRWPKVQLAQESFALRLNELVRDESELDAVRRRATDDLYLAWACLEGSSAAHVEFERAFLVHVPSWVKRVVRSEARAEEVRQEVARRLLVRDGDSPPRIELYAGKGPLAGWVRVCAMRVAHNIRASQHSLKGVPFDSERVAPDLDAEVAVLRKVYAKQFAQALRDALSDLKPDERTALRLHYLDGLSIDDVGAAYRISRATAARMLARARDSVVRRMEGLLAQQLGADAPEPGSILALIRDELEESLARRLSE